MTDADAIGVAETAFGAGAFRSAAGAGRIVFGRVGEDAKFLPDLHLWGLDVGIGFCVLFDFGCSGDLLEQSVPDSKICLLQGF